MQVRTVYAPTPFLRRRNVAVAPPLKRHAAFLVARPCLRTVRDLESHCSLAPARVWSAASQAVHRLSSCAASRNVCEQEATEMNSHRMLPFWVDCRLDCVESQSSPRAYHFGPLATYWKVRASVGIPIIGPSSPLP